MDREELSNKLYDRMAGEQAVFRDSLLKMSPSEILNHDRLMAMLPFSTLTLSTLDGHKGVFALVHRDEARNRPLHLRSPRAQKPSIKEQLAGNSVSSGQPAKARDKGAR